MARPLYHVASCSMIIKHQLFRYFYWLEPRLRCETWEGLVCDLVWDEEEGSWVLERVWD